MDIILPAAYREATWRNWYYTSWSSKHRTRFNEQGWSLAIGEVTTAPAISWVTIWTLKLKRPTQKFQMLMWMLKSSVYRRSKLLFCKKLTLRLKTATQLWSDFDGSVDGDHFAGGQAQRLALTLGSGQFIPGFGDQLVGHTAEVKSGCSCDIPERILGSLA